MLHFQSRERYNFAIALLKKESLHICVYKLNNKMLSLVFYRVIKAASIAEKNRNPR
jgi:hypothetical protein